ncbi:hypothetical protein [Enterococcus sp. 2201sp1_2201st1_B8_2201SCRN_220225]|uniref:hypothetical protein n=1 Tax=unclassified Enterococcus TaxID=2608891 RepID=UPI0034A11F4B
MKKTDVEKGMIYEAEVVGQKGRQQVQILRVLEKTCTVELKKTGELALVKIESLTSV